MINRLNYIGEIPKRSNGADCKSVGYAYVGSNPALPTMFLGVRMALSHASQAGVAQLVEHQPSELRVAGSNLVSRSFEHGN